MYSTEIRGEEKKDVFDSSLFDRIMGGVTHLLCKFGCTPSLNQQMYSKMRGNAIFTNQRIIICQQLS